MNFEQAVFLVVVFLASALICYVAIRQLTPTPLDKRIEALGESQADATPAAAGSQLTRTLARWLAALGKPSLPSEAWEKSPLRVRFYNAGLDTVTAPVVYFGLKTLLAVLLPALVLLVLVLSRGAIPVPQLLAVMPVLAALGYYLPNAALAHMISHRQRELFEAFPDALDLMRVCVEAGLGMDAAIERVGQEMAHESTALAEEFHLVGLELRAGASRADALRNLALRVALEDIDSMVSMLVQTDRFGTSVAASLRVHADSLRTRRRLIAEEAAAKLPVKMIVPLIFCVLPALLTVLIGPAAINVYRTVVPRLAGQ